LRAVNHDLPYYLALAAVPGIGPTRFKVLLKHFQTAENVWKASDKTLDKILTPSLFNQFTQFRQSFNVDKYLEKIEKSKINVVTIDEENYPKRLKEIDQAPPVLYVKGALPINEKALAVVGTRKITGYGRQATEILVRDLVAAGFTIVSGLAFGVDSHAHRVTVGNGGETIAVLGGGVDVVYPRENEALAREIEEGFGAVISEFPLGMQSVPGNFPARNRIISGLSLGVLVTEAGEDSGSLITADFAAEQGREVFAVPGPIFSSLSKGPSQLIKQGAKLVTNVEDILEELNLDSTLPGVERAAFKADSKEEQAILDLLKGGPVHVDELARASKLPAAKVGSLLSLMELKGQIKNLGQNKYSSTR